MTIAELKELISNVPDNTEVNFELEEHVSNEQLSKMSYPYPYNMTKLCYAGYDIGHSDRVIKLCFEKEK